ncbi:MAG: HlyD family efflux transporter periplasmic adaptor subunit [Armatimonadetes bacterium]|nr:HlyD family efflux transporter periplasmic adaptor subunit [Armatimonadota bacterium]
MKRFVGQYKWVIGTVVLVGLSIGVLRMRQTAETAPAAAPTTASVTRGTIKATVVATGAIQPETSVDVKANAGGEVTSLLVDVGDVVKAGDLLCTIDPTDSQTTVRTSRADLTSSQAQVSQARAADSLDRMTLPAKVTDAVEAIKASRAKLRSAEENLRLAQSTAATDIDSASQDLLIANVRANRAGTSLTMGEGSADAQLRQALQQREQAAASVAQAEATLSLAKDEYATGLESAHQTRASAAARLERARLGASTTPAGADAGVRQAEASLAQARQRLTRLTSATQPSASASAEGDYESAKVSLSAAEAELKRQRELFAKGYVPYTAVEGAETALAAARAKSQAASETWKNLRNSQSADRSEAEAAVAQAEASLAQAKETQRASGTTKYDVADAEATLNSADQSLKLAEAGQKTVQMRTEQLRSAKSALASAEAGVQAAQSQMLDVKRLGNDVTEAGYTAKRSEIAKAQAEASRRTIEMRSADVDAARAALRQAEAQLTQVYAQRFKLAQNRGAVTQAAASVVRNEAQVFNAEKQLRDTIIRAPRDGVVIDRSVEEGTIISSGRSSVTEGTKILTLADVRQLYCLAAVDESDVGKVYAGQKAQFKVEAFGDRQFPATVRKVYPKGTVTANITQFTVELAVTKTEVMLRPGMSADIEILTEERPNVLVLPAEAVREGPGGFYVMMPGAAGAGKAKASGAKSRSGAGGTGGAGKPAEDGTKVPIKVGITTAESIEIVEGLKEGDKVLVPAAAGNAKGGDKQSNNEQMQKAIKMGMKSMGAR